MINREMYMEKLWDYKDTEFIKVITGIRGGVNLVY